MTEYNRSIPDLMAEIERLKAERDLWKGLHKQALLEAETLEAERDKLKRWVAELQSGQYVNCMYCGHCYGPVETTPTSKAEMLRQHIEQCPEHPMSKLKAERDRLRDILLDMVQAHPTGLIRRLYRRINKALAATEQPK